MLKETEAQSNCRGRGLLLKELVVFQGILIKCPALTVRKWPEKLQYAQAMECKWDYQLDL